MSILVMCGQTTVQQYLPIHITHLDGFCKLLLLFTDLIEFHIIMLSSYVPPCSFVCALKPLIIVSRLLYPTIYDRT
jgi:hypothetical protein